jgi:hypothetical protein
MVKRSLFLKLLRTCFRGCVLRPLGGRFQGGKEFVRRLEHV